MSRKAKRRIVEVNGISMDMALAEQVVGEAKVMEFYDRERAALVRQIEDLDEQRAHSLNRLEGRQKSSGSTKKRSTTRPELMVSRAMPSTAAGRG